MGKGKETRQKMINLMYLVFIAMMAMNVDRQVLRSFESITVTLDDSSKLTNENNVTFYDNIANKAKDDPEYMVVKSKAAEVKAKSDEIFNMIEEIRAEIMANADKEGYELPTRDIMGDEEQVRYNVLQNSDVITKLLFTGKDGPNEKGTALVEGINNYKEFMLGAFPGKTNQDRIEALFDTSNVGRATWLHSTFYDQPMIAGVANLTKLQSDVRTEEGNLVRALLSDKLESDIELKAFKPIVMVPPFVRQGESVDASIAFGAFDNTLKGEVTMGGQVIPLRDGVAEFALSTSGSGMQNISGTMTYERGDGEIIEEPFDFAYEIVSETLLEKPEGAVISADAMNVVYRQLDNPISATVSGADSPVSLSANVAGLKSAGAGKWIFNPSAGSGTVTFTANATTSTGKTVSGSREFRIKPVPPARGVILGKTNITVPANGMAAQTVKVDWPDFLFDLTATVTSFKVKVAGQPTAVVDGTSMGAAAGVLNKARKGDAVFVFDIKYRSSTGITGTASPITIEVR